jgi:hypothetical protein
MTVYKQLEATGPNMHKEMTNTPCRLAFHIGSGNSAIRYTG